MAGGGLNYEGTMAVKRGEGALGERGKALDALGGKVLGGLGAEMPS